MWEVFVKIEQKKTNDQVVICFLGGGRKIRTFANRFRACGATFTPARYMAAVAGIEPAMRESKSRALTAWPHGYIYIKYNT